MISTQKKNAIIGFATNQDAERVSAFCRSIRKQYDKDACDVVLAVNQPEIVSLCRDFDVTPLPSLNLYQKKHATEGRVAKQALYRLIVPLRRWKNAPSSLRSLPDALLETVLHPHLGRWFFYKRALEFLPSYRKILISDVSDVFFQAPFFEHLAEDRIAFFSESGRYGQSVWNDRNYSKLYGDRQLANILGRPVVCLGVLGGGERPVRHLVSWMISSVYARPNGGSDQVRGNRYAHVEGPREAIETIENGTGAVLHINAEGVIGHSGSSVAEITDRSIVTRRDKKIIPVVHMYNRHPQALAAALTP